MTVMQARRDTDIVKSLNNGFYGLKAGSTLKKSCDMTKHNGIRCGLISFLQAETFF